MVYTFRTIGGQEVAADALERDVNHGREATVHPGLHPRLVRDGLAVSSLRDQSAHGIQVGQAIRGRGLPWARGAFTPT